MLAPVARPGTRVSLRVPEPRPLSPRRPGRAGTFTAEGARLLAAVVAQRLAFLVTGGTGVGKTTLLAGLLSLVDPAERLVLVEDASELRPDHPHVVGLEARPPNVEGAGEVTVRTLVRQALRMRPDRLVVGEVRGGAVTDLLAALNTGHEGGCGTLHANSAADVPARVEALALAAGWTRGATHSQLAAALHLVVHLGRRRDGTRVLREVALPRRGAGGLVTMESAVAFNDDGATRLGPASGCLERSAGSGVIAAAVVLAATTAWLLVRPPPRPAVPAARGAVGWWPAVAVASAAATLVVGPGALSPVGWCWRAGSWCGRATRRRASAETAGGCWRRAS